MKRKQEGQTACHGGPQTASDLPQRRQCEEARRPRDTEDRRPPRTCPDVAGARRPADRATRRTANRLRKEVGRVAYCAPPLPHSRAGCSRRAVYKAIKASWGKMTPHVPVCSEEIKIIKYMARTFLPSFLSTH